MALNSLIASILSPVVPYGQGLHEAGRGMGELADFNLEQKRLAQQAELQRAQMAQQAAAQQQSHALGMRNANNQDAHRQDQLQLRRDQMAATEQAAKERRINGLRDMLGKARQAGDVGAMRTIDAELRRNGWSISDTPSGAQAPPQALSPGGLPQSAPTSTTTPGDLPVGGAATPQARNKLLDKLSPQGQVQLEATAKAMNVSTDALLRMMEQESGLDPTRRGGDGRRGGLYQLDDDQAAKMFGPGKRLNDLPDHEQIASYQKYSAGKNVKSDVDLMVNQLAPRGLVDGPTRINTADPNAVMYTAEETAKWPAKQREINAPLLNPDGSMTVGSASKGYGIGGGGQGSNAERLLSPLPPATRQSAGAREYRDDKGHLVERYDAEAEHQRMSGAVKDALVPLGYDPSNPASKAAGETAAAVGSRLIGVMGPEKAFKAAEDAYQAAMNRQPKTGPVGNPEKEERHRLQAAGTAVQGIYSKVAANEKYATISTLESNLNQGFDLIKGARSGLGDTVAIKQLVKSLSGVAASDREYRSIVDANGVWSRLERGINTVTDNGQMPDQLIADLENVMTVTQREANRRRGEAANAAETLADGALLTMKPDERAGAKKQLRKMFLPNETADDAPADRDNKPASAASPPPKETTGSQVVDPAKKAALDRARKLLGL